MQQYKETIKKTKQTKTNFRYQSKGTTRKKIDRGSKGYLDVTAYLITSCDLDLMEYVMWFRI